MKAKPAKAILLYVSDENPGALGQSVACLVPNTANTGACIKMFDTPDRYKERVEIVTVSSHALMGGKSCVAITFHLPRSDGLVPLNELRKRGKELQAWLRLACGIKQFSEEVVPDRLVLSCRTVQLPELSDLYAQ